MKIAILTQPLHTNFGGTLQAYALQKVLINLGCKPETIDFKKKELSNLHKFFASIKHKILNRKIYYFTKNEYDLISLNHDKFINNKIITSTEINKKNKLEEYFSKKEFDAIVVGSDQVWRKQYSPNIDCFFLDFLKNNKRIKKVAYAASFGVNDWEFSLKATKKYTMLLNEFDYISVREISAVELCRNKLNAVAEHVLDPTLLLKAEDYLKLINESKYENKEYKGIFCYILDPNLEKQKIINYVSNFLSKNNYYAQPKSKIKDRKHISNIEDYTYPSIENWLNAIYCSDYVITDSFHGVVFSIIFNKQFICLGNAGRGMARFESILSIFNLKERLVNNIDGLNTELLLDNIDYEEVNNMVEKYRQISISRLEKSLKG
ncbi:polysaccharide pyruvyl transferase family protein [Acinetobacter terrestris]|uniref:polysaccharide pyruvyl transferase family protein n=1 Tax=Acinetobacter terrestris TaxID=2529843 RepID=UPI00103B3FBF|nr:polysaccharide pyruvyl transferase family protein [Acinetobacter terrestris]TCB65703.1 polysaccharide pyruvyl transferase family protein [Acinetobacter terrestris]